MNIIKYEFYKVLHKKLFWLFMAVMFILNTFLYINEQNNRALPISKSYYSLENEYSKLSYAASISEVNKTSEELSVLSQILSLRSNSVNELSIKEQLTPILQTFKPPIKYDELIEKYKSSPYMKDDVLLREYNYSLNLIKSQLLYIADYPNFINSMEEKAETMKSVSIFNKPNTFAYRNIIKTTRDFQHLKGISLKMGDENGIVTATTFNITDLFIMSLIFLLCVYLFIQEKENDVIGLVKSNVNGRLPVILSKVLVLVVLVVFCSLIFYSSILILGNHIYGFGDTSRYIQSMSNFRDCNIFLTVKDYLFLFLTTKTIVAVITSIVFALFFTLLSNTKSAAVVLGIFLGGSYICYKFIHPVSLFNVFKYLNIFAFFDVNSLYARYVNINLFGYPQDRVLASILTLALVLAIATSACIFAFTKLYINSDGVLAAIFNKLSIKRTKISGNTNLFLHESFKVMLIGKVYIVIIFSLLIGYYSIDFKELLVDHDNSVYTGYINNVQGPITEEKIEFIKNEQSKFNNIPKEIEKLSLSFKNGEIKDQDYKIGLNNISLFTEKQKGFAKLKNQYEYLSKLKQDKGIVGSFINEISSDYIFKNPNRDLINGVLYTFLLILSLCSIFPMDKNNDVIDILKCTVHGRLKLFFYKYIIAYIIAFFLMVIVYLPYYINLLRKYNIVHWFSPVKSISIYENCNINISILGFILLVNLLQLISALAMVNFILYISSQVKKQSFSIIIGVILFVLPLIMSLLGISSINMFTLTNGFTLFSSFTHSNCALINSIYFIVLIILSIWSIFRNAKKSLY